VLIHGAGGGVGHLAVQLAHGLGAHVIATGSPGKRDWVMSLGAGQFIDYASEDFTAVLATDPVDLTLDFIGKSVGVGSAAVTRPGGLILQFNDGVDEESRSAANAAGVRIAGPAVHIDKPQLGQLVKKLNAGELRVTVAKSFKLADIVKAHAALDAGHAAGKIVVHMN
jgi:NADPH:quinone reductase